MKKLFLFLLIQLVYTTSSVFSQQVNDLYNVFANPPESAKPWVFWYWMQASVSREGITADLEAMKQAGLGGAYLMPIKGVANPPFTEKPVLQMTPAWWDMMRHAMKESDRLGLKIAMHVSDGFALAGGPWITPELSMQKIVWTETQATGGRRFQDTLPLPAVNEGYYRDISVFAFPSPNGEGQSSFTTVPVVTTSKPGEFAQFLVIKGNKELYRSSDPCSIQYAFEQPFTCRSITIQTDGKNYFSNRLLVEASDDGINFRRIAQLEPPRSGWQDWDAPVTHAIEPATARYFRFVYNKAGSEPGSEDIDAAKWKPSLSLRTIELSGSPRVHQFEGKSAQVWRVSKRTTSAQLPDSLCVPLNKIINITQYLNTEGRLDWNMPAGQWTILRVGHTSTGYTNATGGGGKGLECDKFNPEAIKKQFDGWFGEAVRQAGPDLAARVLKIFHIDSWECGSQNWSPVFREEFRKRRGYDLFTYLPVMAGIPIGNADISEKFLHDLRKTIAELVVDNFYGTMGALARAKGYSFSAESVAPTMPGDGMAHYGSVDIPMGEFWLNSPTHDKPNDMLDAISGAHIYGKRVIQAEAFTQLRSVWDEYPGMLKTIQDRNYAMGINRMVYHVFTHNPWMDRKPGMTLDGIGLYFQRDQTWWKQGRAWVDYARRCQALLQLGRPVADIAVFTGEETPRRALLPDRLVSTLPGIFGAEVVKKESERLANIGEPLRTKPVGVVHSANMADPENWTDPLRGYAYDSYNRDALLRLSSVRNGDIVLEGGASYKILVLPGAHPMSPDTGLMSPEVANRLRQLAEAGATLIVSNRPRQSTSLQELPESDKSYQKNISMIWAGNSAAGEISMWKVGKGRIIKAPFLDESFEALGVERDLTAKDETGKAAGGLAWTHRTGPGFDIYFISNQLSVQRSILFSLRQSGRIPELWNPVTGDTSRAKQWRLENGRTVLPLRLDSNGSVFIIFRQPTSLKSGERGVNWTELETLQSLQGPWQVTFNQALGGPAKPVVFNELADWSLHEVPGIRYYSGPATYSRTFNWEAPREKNAQVWLELGRVANIAEITLNGISCGVAWTYPYRVNITKALKAGKNQLTIEVANTWANRLIGDHALPETERITHTNAPYRLEGKPLLEAGLLGPVTIGLKRK